jgi:spore coat polysaccharide biosynthesis protein SpsF
MKKVIVIQARMTSTRLPGKILKPVLGKPLLEYQLERLKRVPLADEIVVATTLNATDQPVVELCKELGISCLQGSENDVLARYHQAYKAFQADVVLRITSDCPLIDPQVVGKVLSFYLENYGTYDYVSNCLDRTYPRGMDTEVFSGMLLQEIFDQAAEPLEREHVTAHIYRHPERYKLANVAYHHNESHHRWTVDTPEDFEIIRRIIEALYPVKPQFTMEDVLQLLEKHADWSALNSHIEQKKLGQ